MSTILDALKKVQKKGSTQPVPVDFPILEAVGKKPPKKTGLWLILLFLAVAGGIYLYGRDNKKEVSQGNQAAFPETASVSMAATEKAKDPAQTDAEPAAPEPVAATAAQTRPAKTRPAKAGPAKNRPPGSDNGFTKKDTIAPGAATGAEKQAPYAPSEVQQPTYAVKPPGALQPQAGGPVRHRPKPRVDKNRPGLLETTPKKPEKAQPVSRPAPPATAAKQRPGKPVPAPGPARQKEKISLEEIQDLAPADPQEVTLQAISWSSIPEERLAVINNRVIREKDPLDAYLIEMIGKDFVVLVKDGKRWVALLSFYK